MKKLANLKGVKALNKNEQKNVIGGVAMPPLWGGSEENQCHENSDCPNGVNHQTGNWCIGYCVTASLGNHCHQ